MLDQNATWLYPLRLRDRKHNTLTGAGLWSDRPAQLHAAPDPERIRASPETAG